ncbi:hypothetical protein TNCV_3270051 [Trichonephila clavipes]|uniref:Uncharacterized protein n=1 Tax=Trichonephila clavipes TaxID=2585209 RepID=A0A8X6SDR5_TRICX|nr:hypothetical protein TNCV_3270051 [Trichonephila clavipes]
MIIRDQLNAKIHEKTPGLKKIIIFHLDNAPVQKGMLVLGKVGFGVRAAQPSPLISLFGSSNFSICSPTRRNLFLVSASCSMKKVEEYFHRLPYSHF